MIVFYSALSVAPAIAQTQCPTCEGRGYTVCSYCDGTGEIIVEEGTICPICLGSGVLTPTIITKSTTAWKEDGRVFVRAMMENEEDLPTWGTVTAEVTAPGRTYKGTASAVFQPHEEIAMVVIIDSMYQDDYDAMGTYIPYEIWLSEVEDIDCSTCDATGYTSGTITCSVCGGIGAVDCVTCDGTGIYGGVQNGGLNVPLDIAVPAIGVAAVAGVAIAAVVVVKKRKVSEKDLRKLPPDEFKNWVLKKLAGKSSSLKDSRIGIDGYTIEGHPISIKQSEGIDRTAIEKFASAMGQSRAKNGIIVAYSFGSDAYTGKVKAKLNYRLEIQMLTVKDLIESKKRPV